MLKISIITINYNNLAGLKRTVESVVNQSWQEFEYIVIDGGSTDGSADYIESKNHNIDYWVSEPDKGIYNAMNKGIKVATGAYLLFLNSGDQLFSNFVLEQNHRFLEKYDLVYFNVEFNDWLTSKKVSFPNEMRFSFFFHSALCHQSVLMKKELFDNLGLYDENLRIVSDWKFIILALFKHNCSYLKVDEILSIYYLDGISYTEDLTEERNQVLKEYFSGYIKDYMELDKNFKNFKNKSF